MYVTLSKSPLFKGLTPESIEDILQNVHHQIRNYPPKTVLAFSGEECQNLMVIIKGKVTGEMVAFSGKTLKVEDIEAPRAIASAFLFGKENKFPVNVTVVEETQLLLLPRDAFVKLMQNNQVILQNYLNMMATRAQFLSRKLRFHSFKTLKGKIAHFILQEAGKEHNSITLSQTQQQLADLFGVARPSLARALGEFAHEGIISINRKNITILNKKELASYLQKD